MRRSFFGIVRRPGCCAFDDCRNVPGYLHLRARDKDMSDCSHANRCKRLLVISAISVSQLYWSVPSHEIIERRSEICALWYSLVESDIDSAPEVAPLHNEGR